MHKLFNENYFNIKICIILMTFIILCVPMTTNIVIKHQKSARSHISLGPCTWVIDRPCPDDDIRIYLYTRHNPKDRQLIYIDNAWETSNLSNSNFNPFDPVKIIMHGYNSDMFLTPLIQMRDEYLQRGNYNLFYIDWSALAPGPCYPSAVHNTRHVGKCIAQLVDRILDGGTGNIHLIGFSLGAHLGNYIANSLPYFRIPRITGLDPALPLFITASPENKLDASDAEFVDVIHTNALVQGKIERCGHVDFYMNGGILQPGCFQNGENPFACSHHRAPDYFSESIRSYRGFWGWSCSSYVNYLLGLCPPTNYLVLAGEDCATTTNGMYLITTNSVPPFANGRFTDLSMLPKTSLFNNYKPFTKADPLQKEIDQWGKLEGTFNNIDIFPTPYSQDPNGNEWPYFNELDTSKLSAHKYINDYYDDEELLTMTSTNSQTEQQSVVTTNKSTMISTSAVSTPVPVATTPPPPPPSLLRNNTIYLNNLKLLFNKNKNIRTDSFIENYKRNISMGIQNPDIFKIPELIELN